MKHTRYGELGIEHYWIVDPRERSVTCFRLEGGIYRTRVPSVSDDVLRHPDFDGMAIDVSVLWDGPPSDQSSAS